MLNKIIQFSIGNKLLVGLGVLILLVYGSYQLTRLPIDAVPDITNNQVQVITVAPSFGAADIERLVTFPIEQVNSNIPGLIEIRSFSRFGLSLVTIVFDDKTDVYWARQQVAERLQTARQLIPQGIGSPELGPVSTGLGEIYQYVLQVQKGFEARYSQTELRAIQDWIVRRQLLSVKGVAEVSSFGGRLRQYEVAVDPQKLQSFHLSIQDVFVALEKNNENTGGAYIEKGPSVLNIRTEGLLQNAEEIGSVVIRNNASGAPLLMRDLAQVKEGSATRFGALTLDDKGEVAGGVVMMLKGANSSDVIKDVKLKIEDIQKILPEGISVLPFLDRTKMVNNAISTVEKNLMEGALIVILVLVLFLGNFRAGLLVASVIPLSMLFAVILMNAFGVSGNLMSLGALDFGLIVDGAVIIVEAVMHQLHGHKNGTNLRLQQQEMDRTVSGAAGRMMNSAVFGQLIILVVYLPIFTLQGIEGKMFKPMAQTVAFALLGAFILSLTYIPMMSAIVLSKTLRTKENFSDRLMNLLSERFRRLLEKVLGYPKIAITTVLLLLFSSIFILSQMGGEFIPTLEEGDFAVETRLLTGSSIKTTVEETQKAAKILKEKFPEVIHVVCKIGSGEVPTDPMPMEAADMMIVLKDKSEWTSATTFDDLANKMTASLEDVPGLTFSFQYPVQMRFNELMTGAKQDVVVKIYGEDLDTLARYAEKLSEIVKHIEGAQDLYVETVTGMPQIIIDYNRSALAQYGLSVAELNRIVNMAFAGQVAGTVFESERRFSLVVRLAGDKRSNLQDVQNLLIPTNKGTQLPLSHFARVEVKNGPNQIQREEAKRRIIVGFNTRGRDVQSIVEELKTKVEAEINFPAGYYPSYGGTFENLLAAKKRLSIAVPISLLLIFFLLFFTFKSVRQGLLIYTAIPLSAIGGIYALASRGLPFSISAGIGFIALFGVAVLNGIVLVAEFNRLRREGMHDLKEIVLKGTTLRLRPVLMTAAVASLGFLPMALSHGAGAEVQRPLATVVIGGLLLATLLTLFILPLLYVLFEKVSAKKAHVAKALGILCMLFANYSGSAQNYLSLSASIDSALQNNLQMRQADLKRQYAEALIKTGVDLPKTMVGVEYGQINSSYKDNRFTASQTLNFPTVYSKQKDLLQSGLQESMLGKELKAVEIKREVTDLYYEIQILRQKQKLLLRSDSQYTQFVERAKRRYSGGETNVLEKVTAETQQSQVRAQLLQLQGTLRLMILQFQLMTNCKQVSEPSLDGGFKNATSPLGDTSRLFQHPLFLLTTQQQRSSRIQLTLEKSRLLPDVFVAYNNMSMRGTGSDNVFYTGSSRFQSAQIGIGLPLFYGAQRARIRSAQNAVLIAENRQAQEQQQLQLQLSQANVRFQSADELRKYFENEGVPNARAVSAAAGRQFLAGEINYLDYVLLLNQATSLESDYYNALREYNQALNQINYLLNR
jgi:cobalt-zinc-cadmium resistance protein CzcA